MKNFNYYLYAIIGISFITAWFINLFWLVYHGFGSWGGEVLVSLFGIFFIPIGVIHGFYLVTP